MIGLVYDLLKVEVSNLPRHALSQSRPTGERGAMGKLEMIFNAWSIVQHLHCLASDWSWSKNTILSGKTFVGAYIVSCMDRVLLSMIIDRAKQRNRVDTQIFKVITTHLVTSNTVMMMIPSRIKFMYERANSIHRTSRHSFMSMLAVLDPRRWYLRWA
jgi:hypothetical protein